MRNLFILSFLSLFLFGCVGTSKQTNFYQLTPSSAVKASVTAVKKKYNIGVEPVIIAGYLQRPQLVSVSGDANVLNISDFDRWAEPLSSSTQRVIAENVSQYLKNSIVKPLSRPRREYDYRIFVEISRFDGKLGDKAYLNGWWSYADKNSKTIVSKKISYERNIGNSYEELVAAQSEMLGELSLEIAKSFK